MLIIGAAAGARPADFSSVRAQPDRDRKTGSGTGLKQLPEAGFPR